MSNPEQQRDGGSDAIPQDEPARRTRAAQDAHGGSMAPGIVDDTGHPVAAAPDERLADSDSVD
ncbi:hypothetical protein DKT68_29280 [Micromonospora acroterricola]|uniref:GTPase activator n=1 Tax=Micromonospora acroterricola TaxID=2202421 RepID=A0A317CR43_9ACTN|nr:hypothetical protein [Micromonospora acroterricola]PWR04959.1 hypothetical protein DKT68_29280 [Micromonospora acroterricola]